VINRQEVLEKAISKAIAGGWRNEYTVTDEDGTHFLGVTSSTIPMHSYPIIFNHDFAKALWGEESPSYLMDLLATPAWKLHLSQMVIADDPIAYLGENI
jgi:hypothetical protein